MQGYVGEIAHFLQCLQEKSECSPDLRDGCRDLEIVEAINRSAARGGKVHIGDRSECDEA
jgi:predicted dehydrogenase